MQNNPRTPLGLAALLVLLVAACPQEAPVTPPADPTELWVDGALCKSPPPPRSTTGVVLERIFDDAFPVEEDASRITQIVPSPAAPGQWYVVKHKGWILRFDEDAAGHDVVLDLRDGRVSVDNDEAGIVSLAFHPDGTRAFLAYQAPPVDASFFFDSVISSFDVRPDGTLDAESETELFRLPQPFFPHSVDQVEFGPDGYLYAAFGDGGTVGSRAWAADPFSLYGTMVRVDVDRFDTDRGTPYAIPDDNPFADGVDGAPEVFAYGLRNTWRFSIDRETGTVWGGDVGENDMEEVNRIAAGGNYGWPTMEGDLCFKADTCDQTGLTPPVVTYTHDLGISVTGGYVYRGGDLPQLVGRYVYADYIAGTIWSIDAAAEPGTAEPRVEAQADFWISTFAESPDGELYLVRWSQAEHFDKTGAGGIYKLSPAPPEEGEDPFPKRLSQTGCSDWRDIQKPASGLIPYRPSAALWSDGAEKERFLSLPSRGSVTVGDDGDLLFPDGTVLVKHFGLNGRRHETRLYIKHHEVGWRGYSYRWRADQSDADLLTTGENALVGDGVFWRYPSRGQCAICHTDAAGITLGLELSQLAAPLPDIGDGLVGQTDLWFDLGLFADAARPLSQAPLVTLDAEDEPLERRVRSYLHSNCSGCHRPGGPPQSALDLRAETPLADANLCNADPFNGDLGIPGARLLVPGDPSMSVLYQRMIDRGSHRMPPLGSYIVDEDAAALVSQWISAMNGCP